MFEFDQRIANLENQLEAKNNGTAANVHYKLCKSRSLLYRALEAIFARNVWGCLILSERKPDLESDGGENRERSNEVIYFLTTC
jgi:hypothetical protein